jgi:hypothetical protein
MDGTLAFYYSFTPILILLSSLAHPHFGINAYCAELYSEASRRLWVVRTGLLGSGGYICDAIIIDGIAFLDIAWGLHDQK